MRRVFFLVLLIGLGGMAVGLLALGAFPPDPRQLEVKRVLPNDRFGPRP